MKPEQLAEIGEKEGAIAITDHGTCSGHIPFYIACKNKGVKPLLGVEAYFQNDRTRHHITVIAKNNDGYKHILKTQSMAAKTKGKYALISLEFLAEKGEDVVVLSGCSGGLPVTIAQTGNEQELQEVLTTFELMFPNFFVEFQPNNDYIKDYMFLLNVSQKMGIPHVITNDVHYANRHSYRAYKNIFRILTKNDPRLKLDWLYPWEAQEIHNYYVDRKFPRNFTRQAVDNSRAIADMCEVDLTFDRKWHFVEDWDLAEKICSDKLKHIISDMPEDKKVEYIERFSYEMKILKSLELIGYLLFCHEILRHCEAKDIPFGPGRGSCVGSLVCYLLDITAMDPLKYDLSFERFLSPNFEIGIE